MKSRLPFPRAPQRGFTLIEVMVVMVVVAILAAVAYPSFLGSVRASRRADAVDAITRIQQAQERWRANNASYASNSQLTGSWPAGLGESSTSKGGYYTLAISANSATAYTITATAVAGKSQAKDLINGQPCTMVLTVSGNNTTYSPALCWKR